MTQLRQRMQEDLRLSAEKPEGNHRLIFLAFHSMASAHDNSGWMTEETPKAIHICRQNIGCVCQMLFCLSKESFVGFIESPAGFDVEVNGPEKFLEHIAKISKPICFPGRETVQKT
jgi:hypothetical protein